MATGQVPQRLRKPFDLPALVAIARAKCHPLNWSFSRVRLPRLHRCTRSLVQLARSSLVASFTLAVPLSVLSCCHLRGEPRSRDLDAVPRYPYCYRSRSDNRLESVAYAHTAADLHVRPVSRTALVKDRGRREQLTNTPCCADGNEIDSKIFAATTARGMPQQGRCSPRKSNALIHFADSTRAATVTFSSKWKIKVTPPSWKPAAPSIFPNGAFRFADKSRERRIFFCALKQGNSCGRLTVAISSWRHATALSRNVREVSGAAKVHLARCTGRTTEVSESVTPLARAAQGIGEKKSPG